MGLVKLAGQGESGGGCDGLSSWCPGRIWLGLVVKVQRQVGMYCLINYVKKMAFSKYLFCCMVLVVRKEEVDIF